MTQATPAVYAAITAEWHADVVAAIIWVMVGYLILIGPVRRRFRLGEPVPIRQIGYFSLGLLTLLFAEASPLHVVSEVYLFSGHMLQHVLLTLVMPPLLLLGLPGWCFRFLLVRGVRPVARVLTSPIAALALFNALYTLWHLPVLYQAALYNHSIHVLEHIIMTGTALLMWWPITSYVPALPRISQPLQVVYVFFMAAAQIGIFAVVTFANDVFYAFYADAPRLWGITPHQDQQLAGIVMKVGGMFVFLYVLARAFFGWARQEEQRLARSQRERAAEDARQAGSAQT